MRRAARAAVFALSLILAAGGVPSAPAVQTFQPLIVSDDPADWTPHVLNGRVNALVQVGNTMYAGGSFDFVREAGDESVVTRNNMFAFDVTTGEISEAFGPRFRGKVFALATDGASLYVGGTFSKSNGAAHRRIVKLDLGGNTVLGFDAHVTAGAAVEDLAYANGLLYLGGEFTEVNGVTRRNFAAVDPTTGALISDVDLPFTGTLNGGTSLVKSFDVSPSGRRLVAVGNFTAVAGKPRAQIAVLALKSGSASLFSWKTDRFAPKCAKTIKYYALDVDISPDGEHFAVVTTGGWFGGPKLGKLCDSASWWELPRLGPGQQPIWVDYSGGDTLSAVAVAGTAIYIGGHHRWMNNPFANNFEGPGSVDRRGIAALDPINGVPFSWKPNRKLGNGIFAFLATGDGLWVGSDTDEIGTPPEFHGRIALMPLEGGTEVPVHQPSTLPGDLYTLPAPQCSAPDPSILYRVNAGGPMLPSGDCGPDWLGDAGRISPYRNSGSKTAAWVLVPGMDASVPATTPRPVFSTERFDPGSTPEMHWSFDVPAGTNVQVRLYFAGRSPTTQEPGDRVFDVVLEGAPVLEDYDIVADAGWDVGTMKAFDLVSDGAITIDFGHVTNDPLLNAIALVDLDAAPVVPGPSSFLTHRAFDGTAAGPPANLDTSGADWSEARGAFVTNGRIYTAWGDGKFFSRPFDDSSLGKEERVFLHGLTDAHFPVASITGMFFENGRLYYTLAGNGGLYYRYFTPEGHVLGAETFVASVPTEGFRWASVRGMALAEGKLYLARTNGKLYSIDWAAGLPVAGSRTLVDGAAAQQWASRGMFIWNA